MNQNVIYTAIFGEKDELLEPKVRPAGFDFICFTDRDFHSDVWQIRKIDPGEVDRVRNARKIKILAHEFLPEYEISFWIDGNMLVRGDLNELIEKYLQGCDMAVYDHAQTRDDPRGTVAAEFKALEEMGKKGKFKDNLEDMRRQIAAYGAEGFPDDNGLISSMVMLRRHNASDVIETMNVWWSQIQQFSRRDQLSFNYAAWKTGLRFVYMAGDSRDNAWFKQVPHAVREQWDGPR